MSKPRLLTCSILFAFSLVLACSCLSLVGVGRIDEFFRSLKYLPRQSDIPSVQEEMNVLVQTITTYNSDTLLQEWEVGPIRLITSQVNGGCIGGAIKLVYQQSKPLSEVASDYASLFATEARQRTINDEIHFDVEVSEKSTLTLFPITNIPPWLPRNRPSYPDQCASGSSCYEISISFSDPSMGSCSG